MRLKDYDERDGKRVAWDNLMRRFGHDCPECDDPEGMLGTVSCSECGHIPKEVRA
jgi:hypothetical protein